jgi:hypothetical protein
MLAAPILIDRSLTNYWVGVNGKDIVLIQDGGQIKREMDVYYHGLRPIYIICQFPDPPYFCLVITFK